MSLSGTLRALPPNCAMSRPKVMSVIHTPNDTLEQVDAVAAAKGIDAVEAALREWDRQSR